AHRRREREAEGRPSSLVSDADGADRQPALDRACEVRHQARGHRRQHGRDRECLAECHDDWGKRMHVMRALKIGGVFLLLATVTVGAGRSDVADAAMRGDRAAVRTLLDQHADVNAAQADGATALHWAVYRSDKDLVDVLIRAGANVKAANREGST